MGSELSEFDQAMKIERNFISIHCNQIFYRYDLSYPGKDSYRQTFSKTVMGKEICFYGKKYIRS